MQRALDELGLDGIDVRRGVEDERAFEAGINNRVTAEGLVALLRAGRRGARVLARTFTRDARHPACAGVRNGIPARLPRAVRVAHKTGEISTVAHDAGRRLSAASRSRTSSPSSRSGRPKQPAARRRSPKRRMRCYELPSPPVRPASRMAEASRFPLRVVDGLRLDQALRDVLLPGHVSCDDDGATAPLAALLLRDSHVGRTRCAFSSSPQLRDCGSSSRPTFAKRRRCARSRATSRAPSPCSRSASSVPRRRRHVRAHRRQRRVSVAAPRAHTQRDRRTAGARR